MNKSHIKFVKTISKVDNDTYESRSTSYVSDNDQGIGKGKLRLICHN